jgi:hypothetical protein
MRQSLLINLMCSVYRNRNYVFLLDYNIQYLTIVVFLSTVKEMTDCPVPAGGWICRVRAGYVRDGPVLRELREEAGHPHLLPPHLSLTPHRPSRT